MMIPGKLINAVLVAVRDMAPDDADAQLSILGRAFVIGCRSCQVDRAHALNVLGELFDEDIELTPLTETAGGVQ